MTDLLNQTIKLKGGRRLGYAEYGDLNGRPVFYFHGEPGSRRSAGLIAGAAETLHIHLVNPEYPGIGLSDPRPGYRLLDWTSDVLELAEALKLGQFGVMGMSGGGPFTLACAYKIPRRLSHVALVSAAGPFTLESMQGMSAGNIEEYQLARGDAEEFYSYYEKSVGDAETMIPELIKTLPPADQEVCSRPEVLQALIADVKEAFRQGTRGTAYQAMLYVRPYGFDLRKISLPVDLWQGKDDVLVPLAMGRSLASQIPSVRGRFVEGEGHLSLLIRHAEEILRQFNQ